MALTALLIVVISAVANRFGPVVAGVISALPTVASVLAVSTHRRQGPEASVDLLRGMLGGMTAFAMFLRGGGAPRGAGGRGDGRASAKSCVPSGGTG